MKKYLSLIFVFALGFGCAKFEKRAAWAYRALHWSKLAGESVDAGLATWLRSKTTACVEKHGSKTAGYAECIASPLALVKKWTSIVVQLKLAQKTSLSSLEIAWSAKKGDVYAAIKTPICILSEFVQVAKNAGFDFGDADKVVEKVLALSVSLCK